MQKEKEQAEQARDKLTEENKAIFAEKEKLTQQKAHFEGLLAKVTPKIQQFNQQIQQL